MSNAPVKPQLPRDASGGLVQGGNASYNITANNAGQLVYTGPTYLHQAIIGKSGSADWAIKIYDGTDATGKLLGTFDFNAGGTYPFNIFCQKGIFYSAAGTTAGDVTLVFVDESQPL